MIKAVLLDLDDTLIHTDTFAFFDTYLKALAAHCAVIAPPAEFLSGMLADYTAVAASEADGITTLHERLLQRLSLRFKREVPYLEDHFTRFYVEQYPALAPLVRPQPASSRLLDHLFECGYRVVVATNPGIPLTAIEQRMAWGGITPHAYPFDLITCLETMHYGKPHASYYAEILCRLDLEPGEAIMVGDDWEQDIRGAAAMGMHTYWVAPHGAAPPGPEPVDAYGPYERFVDMVRAGWLDNLPATQLHRPALLQRIAVFPAALDALCRLHTDAELENRPAAHEFSARDVVCHLRDYAAQEDRSRLQLIVEHNTPFLSGNYDPWANAHLYAMVPCGRALAELDGHRRDLVAWIDGLPESVWPRPARHAIFGNTTFDEMVRFIVRHDRTHLRQMQEALRSAHDQPA